MKTILAQCVLTLAVLTLGLGAVVFAPDADADPVSAVGDGPGPMADVVCRTLDNDPSVAGVRRMMQNFTGFMMFPGAAWETILNGVVWNGPQHADLLKDYARFYGNH